MSATLPAVDAQQTGPSSTGSSQSPVGSPPLILAFLAIGIFSAAMIAVFGWRRVQFGREPLWGYTDTTGHFGRGTRGSDSTGLTGSILGEKPVLWEVYIDRSKRVEGGEYAFWDNTMPLAVLPAPRSSDPLGCILGLKSNPAPTTLSPGEPIRSPESSPFFPLPQAAGSRRRQLLTEINPMSIFRRHPHTSTTPNTQPDPVEQEHSNEKDKEEEKDAHIVTIIEMPSPTRPRYRHAQGSVHKRISSHYSSLSIPETLVDNTGQVREDLLGVYHDSGEFQFCIGVHTCPWPLSRMPPAKSNNGTERIPQSHSGKELG